MNEAEKRVAAEIAALSDLDLLQRVLAEDELTTPERGAFCDMCALLLAADRFARRREVATSAVLRLSKKQRAWAEEVALKFALIRAADVPRGREVETPAVLRTLPKKPPPRREE